MSETPPELSFDRATYASPSASAATTAPCSSCKRPLAARYWKWQRMVLCDACRDGLAATLAKSQSGASFGKAFLKGGGAALGCGIAYAVFVGVTKSQFALATIGIAYVVAMVVRKASHGVSGRRFQVLAVALTYVASTMGYAPGIFDALKGAGKHHAAAPSSAAGIRPANTPPVVSPDSTVTPGAPSAPAPAEAEDTAAGGEAAPKKPVSLGQFAIAIGFLVGLTLAAPFLELTDAPLGVIIIAIGLWEAWRRSRGLPIVIEGPFQVAQAREVPQQAPPPQEAVAPPEA